MKNKITALALIAFTALSLAPKPAQAHDKGLALVGGLLGGLIIGSAIADSHHDYYEPRSTTVTSASIGRAAAGCSEGADAFTSLSTASITGFSRAEPDTIQPGGTATLSWASQGITSLSIDQGVGDVSSLLPNGSLKLSPGATTTYTATATAQSGAKLTQQVVVSVAQPPVPTHPIKHIIVMLQENRSFDNYFGVLGAYRAARVPGATAADIDGFDPNLALKTKTGKLVKPYH